MKKTVVVIFIIIFCLVGLDKWLSYNDKIRKKDQVKNAIYALRRASLTDEQLNNYGSAGELELYPYLMFKGRSNTKSPTINTNSFGMRAPEIGGKLPGTYRIIIVGGSTAFGGMSTSDDTAYFNVLQKRLNEDALSGYRFEVISAGIPSYNSMQELVLIESKILRMNPDMVIVLDGFNDAVNYLSRDNRPGFPYMFKDLEKYTNTKSFLLMRLRKIRIARKIMEFFEAQEIMNQKTFDYAVVEFYKNNLDIMCHLLQSYGITPIIVLQPAIDYKMPLSELEEEYLKSDKNMSHEVFVKLYDALGDAARSIAEANKVDYLDTRYIFEGQTETLFMDDCHLNDKAQGILAGALWQVVNKNIAKKGQ